MNLNLLLCFGLWNFIRSVHSLDSCTAELNDTGSSLIQQVYGTIQKRECSLVAGTVYKQYDPTEGEEFDFIVVGSGSAGSVIGSRLSENSSWNVLLLEAGGDPTVTAEIPALFMSTFNSSIDWAYKTEPDSNYCLAWLNNSCFWPRGKLIGGSSGINAMMYVRGNPGDFDGWAADGNNGWSYSDVLPYFKKSEDLISEEALYKGFQKNHGTGGYQKVNSYSKHPFAKTLKSIFSETGLNIYKDLNRNNYVGFFPIQGTLYNYTRQSTAKAFIKPAENRPNFKLSKHSVVTKLLISNNSKAVYGVEFRNRKGELIRVKARNEVILSAGSINSPQLLMLSGIGPREHLQEHNIDVVQDLPVGKNLQDHLIFYGLIMSLNTTLPVSSLTDEMYKYLTSTSDILGSIGLLSNLVFMNMSSTKYPDVEFLFNIYNKNDSNSLITYFRNNQLKEEVISSMLELLSKHTLFFVTPFVLRPKSLGEILLKSNNPYDHPKIYPKYYSNEEDLELALKGIRYIINLLDTKILRSLDAKLVKVNLPTCDKLSFNSDEYWICVLRHLSTTVYHPVGTCKMGSRKDISAVVDPRLRVIGLKKLRVADASIAPKMPSGHVQATAIMIGEKAAEFIKRKWKR